MFISTKRTHIDEDIISLYYCSVSNAIGEDQMKMLVVPRGKQVEISSHRLRLCRQNFGSSQQILKRKIFVELFLLQLAV